LRYLFSAFEACLDQRLELGATESFRIIGDNLPSGPIHPLSARNGKFDWQGNLIEVIISDLNGVVRVLAEPRSYRRILPARILPVTSRQNDIPSRSK
jgi:hypothetical protein